MKTPSSIVRLASLAILVPMLSSLAATAQAAEPARSAAAEKPVAAQTSGPFRHLGQRLMKRGGGFGKQTLQRLRQMGERVANHMIANPEDLDQLDEIAATVAASAPELLADEARQLKHNAMSDAVREAVNTVTRPAN